jgi:hypothetical protein
MSRSTYIRATVINLSPKVVYGNISHLDASQAHFKFGQEDQRRSTISRQEATHEALKFKSSSRA